MEIDKIRNLGESELLTQQRDTAEQLFRLRFQMKMGQTESITKIRTLRKDIARIKTVLRQRELGQEPVPASIAAAPAKAAASETPAPKAKAKAAAKPEAKKTAKPAEKKSEKPAAKKTAKKKSEKK